MSDGRGLDTGAQYQSGSDRSIGDRLKAARTQRQLSVDEVASQLRLDTTVISALENNDSDNLPAPIFVQGYLRSYARLLDLPEQELVDCYTSHSGELPPLAVNRVSGSKLLLGLPSMRLIRNIVLLMLIVILLWLAYPFIESMLDSQGSSDSEQSPDRLEIPPVAP